MSLKALSRILRWATVDALVIIVAYILAYNARSLTADLQLSTFITFTTIAVVINIAGLYLTGVYQRLWVRTSGHDVITIIKGVAASTLILLILDLIERPRPVPLSVLIIAQILTFGAVVVLRYRSRLLGALNWRWRAVLLREFPENRENVLIVGAGESGQTTAWRLQHRFDESSTYQVIGFVDDDPRKQGLYVEGRPVLGMSESIPEIVSKFNVSLIVVAIHRIEGPVFRRILELCERTTTARIKVIPDMLALMNATQTTSFLRDVQPEDLIGRSVISRHESVDLSSVSERVVMVTGAAGSIGSELSRQMMSYNPTKLIILDNNESSLHDLHISLDAKHPDIAVVPALVDVTRREDVQDVFAEHRPQIVYHAAAYKHVPMLERYPDEASRVNIGGTFNVSNAALECGVERFVLISTDKAVDPSSIMGGSKRVCERIVQSLGILNPDILFTAVRFGNVLGSRGSVVPTFNRQIDQGGPVTITHPEMSRYFMSISEAVNLVIHAAAMTKGGDIFVLRMGEEVRIIDIGERMIRLRGLRPNIDIDIDIVGIRPGEKLHEELYEEDEQPADTQHPYIMKLTGSRVEHPDELIHKARQLSQRGFGVQTTKQALATLREVGQVDTTRHVLNGVAH